MTNPHPNATAGAGVPGSVAALLYVLDVAGVTIPDPPLPVALVIGGALSGLALLIGRRGVKGMISIFWRGNS